MRTAHRKCPAEGSSAGCPSRLEAEGVVGVRARRDGPEPLQVPREEGSPRRHRSSSSSPSRQKERRDDEKKENKDAKSKEHQITEEDMEGKTEEEIEMMKTMGFGSFDTTKAVHEQKRRIQQTVGFYCLMSSLVTCEE
ncbi:thyrotropin subunit beta [Platysternon megacephalum]|uniref:U4/U6.U5 small nuclear ribonucleoprotein 27 kDa protein n=1 Tax=Platysternon megacephalum TaxID=55544 RepID=A0A4D9DTY0_9SAUR|nr:thyrotropin subunit beta [Platysternon megacephalum]